MGDGGLRRRLRASIAFWREVWPERRALMGIRPGMNAAFLAAALAFLGGLALGPEPYLAVLLGLYVAVLFWAVGFAGGFHLQRQRTARYLAEATVSAGGKSPLITEAQRSALERLNDAADKYKPLVDAIAVVVAGVTVLVAVVALIVG